MLRRISRFRKPCKFPRTDHSDLGFRYDQSRGLVNVKLKWAKDGVLDRVVAGEREVRAAWVTASAMAAAPGGGLPIHRLAGRRRGQLGLPETLKVSTFLRKYPSVFHQFHLPDSSGTPVPWFRLTPEALALKQEELTFFGQTQKDLLDRLCKLLMLTKDLTLPLQTIDQLKWDLGLPHDYLDSFLPNHNGVFEPIGLDDGRIGLRLVSPSDELAVSHLETNGGVGEVGFPIGFPRGFGLKRKCLEWLEEWQRLPYTSPYSDSSGLDPRTDESEKWLVGVFHELLHLTVQKRTERKNVSNLRKPMGLPQKFTKVFERHPGIFYISKKDDTQTVVLREAYDRDRLVYEHPMAGIRRRFAGLMKEGFLDRSRGLYKKQLTEK